MSKLFLYYPASSDALVPFLDRLYNQQRETDHTFFQLTLYVTVGNLLVDLGHYGRGYEAFHICTIPTDQPRGGEKIELVMLISDLISHLVSEIDDFLTTHPYRQDKPDLFKRELAALQLLAKQLAGQRVKVFLTNLDGNLYGVKRVEVMF
jgi:hypothetical protein